MVCGYARASKARTSPRAYALGGALSKLGYDVHILVSPYDFPEDSGRCYEEEGYKVRNLEIRNTSLLELLPVPFRLVSEVNKLRPDVVHIFKPKGFSGAAGAILELRKRYPLVVDCDDWEGDGGWNDVLPHPWLVRRFINWQERWIPSHANAVTLNSIALRKRYREDFGISDDKIFYIPNGPNLVLKRYQGPSAERRLSIREKLAFGAAPVVVYVGTYTKADETEQVLDVAEIVLRKRNAGFLFLGAGPELENLRNRATAMGLGEKCRFLGHVPHAEVLDYIATADIALYPYPNTNIYRCKCSGRIIEFLSLGKPVVTGAIGQNLEYIEHMSSGVLVDPPTPAAYAEGLLTLLADPELRDRLGEQARTRTWKNYSWNETLVERLVEAYRVALDSFARAEPRVANTEPIARS